MRYSRKHKNVSSLCPMTWLEFEKQLLANPPDDLDQVFKDIGIDKNAYAAKYAFLRSELAKLRKARS